MAPEDRMTRPPRANNTHLALYRRLATVFIVLTVGVLLFAVYVIFARATIVVMSQPEEVKAEFVMDVTRHPLDGEVSGSVFEAEQELSREFPTSKSGTTPAKAEGRVKIASTLSRDQTLVATTRLLTPEGVLYRIQDTINVPAGGSVEVDAAADLPGRSGELTDATFTIPGLKPETRQFFEVTVVKPFVGGEKEGRLVTQANVDQATETLRDELKEQLVAELRQQAADAQVAMSGEAIVWATLDRSAEPDVGAEEEAFTATVRLKATGVFYDQEQAFLLAEERLKNQTPFDRDLRGVATDAMAVSVEKVDMDANRANLRVLAKGATLLSPDAPSLEQTQFIGLTVASAQHYLEEISGVSSVSIKTRPFWSRRLPDIPEHITVEVR